MLKIAGKLQQIIWIRGSVLNRLYIVIGILAILVLSAGFIVPRFMDWDGYRSRLETIAEASLGTDVIIGGEIEFSLLPQPKVRFGNTIIGPAFSPLLEIKSIEAELSLMDFLRDRFIVTKLVLQSPQVYVEIDRNGDFVVPIEFVDGVDAGKISVSDAEIIDGSFVVVDKRTDQKRAYDNFVGELSVSGLLGPYGLKGVGDFFGVPHSLRLNISGLNERNQAQSSFFWRPQTGQYSLAGEGVLAFGAAPKFIGEASFRGQPLFAMQAQEIAGDFVVTGQVELSADKLLLSAFEMQPDENLAGSRLSGAAVINMGEVPSFDAVISGGVVSLAPPDIREENAQEPLGLITFLSQLSPPFVPTIAGRIGVDIAEMSVQGFAMRNVRLDASSDGLNWNLENFAAGFLGDSQVTLSGLVGQQNGAFNFDGRMALQSSRLGGLASLWRDVDIASPLHTQSGNFNADLNIQDQNILLTNGDFSLGQDAHEFEAKFDLSGVDRAAELSIGFGVIEEVESDTLVALLPDISGNGALIQNFPVGQFFVTLEQAVLFDMAGTSLALDVSWTPAGLHVERLSAFDFGGAQFSLAGEVSGNILAPNISGGGRLTLDESAQPQFLPWLKNRLGWSNGVDGLLSRLLPLDVNLDLSPAETGQMQVFSAEGLVANAGIEMSTELTAGIGGWRNSVTKTNANLNIASPDEFFAQTGLSAEALIGEGQPVAVQISMDGALSGGFETQLVARSADELFSYVGFVDMADISEIKGQGNVEFALNDLSAVQQKFGVQSVYLPSAEGSFAVDFGALGNIVVSDLKTGGRGLERSISGSLSLVRNESGATITGNIETGDLDIAQIFSSIARPASLIEGENFWPTGPMDMGSAANTTLGRIAIRSSQINVGDHVLASDVTYNMVWDNSSLSVENIHGNNGFGEMRASVSFCCSGLDVQSQMEGRLSLFNVQADGFLPVGIGQNISGLLSGGVLFEANGASLDEFANSTTGEGSFVLGNGQIHRLDPAAFSALVTTPNIVDLDADALAALVGIALDQGDFATQNIAGVFQIAGGKIRADNIIAANQNANLLADIRIDLSDLSLSGNWTLTPEQIEDPSGLIDKNNAQITASIEGDLLSPLRVLNLSQMVDAIKLRALEIELDELEVLRAEQVARSAELAQNRAQLMAMEAERKEQEAARLAAEELARQQREAEAAAAAAAIQAQEETPFVFELDSQDPLLLQDQLLSDEPLVFNAQPTDLLTP